MRKSNRNFGWTSTIESPCHQYLRWSNFCIRSCRQNISYFSQWTECLVFNIKESPRPVGCQISKTNITSTLNLDTVCMPLSLSFCAANANKADGVKKSKKAKFEALHFGFSICNFHIQIVGGKSRRNTSFYAKTAGVHAATHSCGHYNLQCMYDKKSIDWMNEWMNYIFVFFNRRLGSRKRCTQNEWSICTEWLIITNDMKW